MAGARKPRSLLSQTGEAMTAQRRKEADDEATRWSDPAYRRAARIKGYPDAELVHELKERGYTVKSARTGKRGPRVDVGRGAHMAAQFGWLRDVEISSARAKEVVAEFFNVSTKTVERELAKQSAETKRRKT